MRTALYERHKVLGAKFVEFSGWEMPVQYQGIIPEHIAVRTNAGLFDVSHMGRVKIVGPDAERFLDSLSTNTIAGKTDLSATYTVWPSEQGGCVDDVIVYKQSFGNYFVIVNAGNRTSDLTHLKNQSKTYDVEIRDCYADDGILALQGPKARSIISKIFPETTSLKHMHFLPLSDEIIVSATGYTGEDGFEIYASNKVIVEIWDRLLKEGQSYGLVPVGLGARDTLRLEMGYALYGHEISDTIAANESVSAWTIKWDKHDFIGKKALETIEKSPEKRSEYGIILTDPGIARAGYDVLINGHPIGVVTSGTHSPSLNKAIALILVKNKLNLEDVIEVQIRQQRCKAKVVKLPFKQ